MPVLNLADDYMVGTSQVDKIYLGGTEVWAPVSPLGGIHASMTADQLSTYGCTYPLTYVFAIPDASSGLTAQFRASTSTSWTTLTEPVDTKFQGINAVRFDYTGDRAYVSVAFTASSSNLYIRVMDGGTEVGSYLGVARYYDNRKVAAIFTFDDWNTSYHDDYVAAAAEFQANELWMSPGFNGGGITSGQWLEVDTAVSAGFVEPINHGSLHWRSELYGTYGFGTEQQESDEDIGQGQADVLDNVTMPPQSVRGATQYLHGYICAGGGTSAAQTISLAATGHLVARLTANTTDGSNDFTYWSEADDLFTATPVTHKSLIIDSTVPEEEAASLAAIASFDATRAVNGFWMFYSYIHWWPSGWGVGTPAGDILAHVASFDDVWSVGLGHAYLYRYTAHRVVVEPYPSFVGFANSAVNSGTVTIPAGAVDDTLVGVYAYSGTAVTPAGWSLVADTKPLQPSVPWDNVAMYRRVADGTETDVVFSGSTQGTQYQRAVVLRYSGVGGTVTGTASLTEAPAASDLGNAAVMRVLSSAGSGRVVAPTDTYGHLNDRWSVASGSASSPSFVVGDQHIADGGSVAAVTTTDLEASGVQFGITAVLPVDADPPGPTTSYFTGGTETIDGSHTVHTFTSSGTLTFVDIDGAVDIEYLVVGGGGGGNRGGGGAGAYKTNFGGTPLSVGSTQTITVAASVGGSSTGGSSSLGSLVTAAGGGAGGGATVGGNGASGGGGGADGTIRAGGSATDGNAGGSNGSTSSPFPSGGGGGAGAAGGSGSGSVAGSGGVGISNAITGTATYYAGGGGGANFNSGGTDGTGGLGGGANGGGSPGAAATPNTGGGGGGGRGATGGGAGGSGVVIIRYLTP